MSLVDVIYDFAGEQTAQGEYELTRRGDGTWSLGNFTPGAPTTLTIFALVVPVSGRNLSAQPEGRTVSEARKIITENRMQIGDVVKIARTPGGTVEDWEVYHVDGPYDQFGEVFYNATAMRRSESLTP